MCQIGGTDTPRCMPRMPRDDEEERFDQRREDQVAMQGQRLRRVGDQVVRSRRRGPARRSGLAVLQGQPGGTPHAGQEPGTRQHADVEPMAAGAVGPVDA